MMWLHRVPHSGGLEAVLKMAGLSTSGRSGEWEPNESAHEKLENPSMIEHSLDRPDVDPCLEAFFRLLLTFR